MFVAIIGALKAIPEIVNMIKLLVSEVNSLRLAFELKQIETFKTEVRIELESIKNATNDIDRKSALLRLSSRLSK